MCSLAGSCLDHVEWLRLNGIELAWHTENPRLNPQLLRLKEQGIGDAQDNNKINK